MLEDVKHILGTTLGLGERIADFSLDTPLLGAIPELDSMAVVTIITALEDHFGIAFYDDELESSTFESVGTLVRFVEQKIGV